MKAYIQDIDELTDSRELLEAKPQPFISIFIYSLILMVLISVIWSYFGEIDENIKAQGIVRPNQSLSSIRNQIAGKVESVNIEEGEQVKKGDLLFTIEHALLDLQKNSLEEEYKEADLELKNLDKLKKSILAGQNYFDGSIDSEKSFSNRFLKYQTDMALQFRQTELNLNTMNEVNEALAGLNTLKQSALQNKNLFVDYDIIYYHQYIDYSLNLESLKDIADQKKELHAASEELTKAGAISKRELDDIKNQLDAAQVSLYKYQNDFMLNVNTRIADNKDRLKQLQINLKDSGLSTDVLSADIETSLQKYKMDTIVQIESDMKALQSNLARLANELETVGSNIKDCAVAAPIDGYVNMTNEISTGDLLQSGTEIATIVPEADTAYKVQLYVSNADIANIRQGQKIKYHFLALPYKEYGELSGTIINIGTDAKVDQTRGSSFYTVEASIENKPLYSYKGIKAEVKIGMECEAQVIIKTKKVLYYLLEKINLRD